MKRKIILPCLLAAGLWLHSYGFPMAYDSYRGHREYGYNAYRENPQDEYDLYSEEQPERSIKRDSRDDFIPVIGIILLVGTFWLSRRLSGGSSSRPSRSGGGGNSNYASRYYSSPSQESPSYSSHSDPSVGHFWGNLQDGTNVKSLWGTTKEE